MVNVVVIPYVSYDIYDKRGKTIKVYEADSIELGALKTENDSANYSKSNYKWKSSNKKVATINSHGIVKAKKVGKTKITVKNLKTGKNYSCTIKVIKGCSISKKLTITEGFSDKIKVKKKVKKLKIKKWSSSNNSIATVDKKGKVKGHKPGHCKIYAVLANGRKMSCSVNIRSNVYIGTKSINSSAVTDDVDYGDVGLTLHKLYYRGNSLVCEYYAYNNRTIWRAGYFTWLKIWLDDERIWLDGGKSLLIKKKFGRINIGLGPQQKKKMTFVINNAKKIDLRKHKIEDSYDYDIIWIY